MSQVGVASKLNALSPAAAGSKRGRLGPALRQVSCGGSGPPWLCPRGGHLPWMSSLNMQYLLRYLWSRRKALALAKSSNWMRQFIPNLLGGRGKKACLPPQGQGWALADPSGSREWSDAGQGMGSGPWLIHWGFCHLAVSQIPGLCLLHYGRGWDTGLGGHLSPRL